MMPDSKFRSTQPKESPVVLLEYIFKLYDMPNFARV